MIEHIILFSKMKKETHLEGFKKKKKKGTRIASCQFKSDFLPNVFLKLSIVRVLGSQNY